MTYQLTQQSNARPWVFPYALLLPATWITIGIVGRSIHPEIQAGLIGTTIIFSLVACSISWLFYKRNNRLLTKRESWRLAGYCTILAMTCELLGLFALLAQPEQFEAELTPEVIRFAIVYAFIFNSATLSIAFRYSAPKFMRKYVLKTTLEKTNDTV